MDPSQRIAIAMVVLYGSLAAGYVARRRRPALYDLSPRMLRFALLFLDCPVMLMLFWLLSPGDRSSLWQLPALGCLAALLVIPVGVIAARLHRMKRGEEGALVCGAGLSNVGYTFGGLLCLAILGIEGATLAQAYAMFITPFTFLVVFQLAAWYAAGENAAAPRAMLARFVRDPARWAPILAMATGVALNFIGPRPPAWMGHAAAGMVLLGTGAYAFAIGVSIRLGKIREHIRPCLTLSVIKFVVTPLIALGLASLFRLDPTQRQVVFVESAMPAAIYSVVVAGLTGLNRDLATSCWLFTTVVALPLVVPIYFIVTGVLAS